MRVEPVPAESLSSWLRRTASIYGLTVGELAIHGLGFRNWKRSWLDSPPEEFLQVVANHSHVALERIRQTALSTFRPHLFAFVDHNFFCEDSVLTIKPRTSLSFGRWLIRKEYAREITGCRICMERFPQSASYLPWRLRLITCCPVHGIMLERIRIQENFAECIHEDPEEAPENVRKLDAMTWEALVDGHLELPSGIVMAKDWFRILRCLAEELFQLNSDFEPGESPLHVVRDAADRFLRTKTESYRWQMSADRKHAVTLATAIEMLFEGRIIPIGSNGKFFILREKPFGALKSTIEEIEGHF